MTTNIRGAITALVTPFYQGEVDYASLEKLVAHQLNGKINGLVINGTTAESPTLTWNEVQKIFTTVRAMVGLNFPLILGTGSNSTTKTIELTQKAEALGADAALVVVPYYNKPPQRGLVEHFKAVARASSTPIIAYNVPGRTITAMNIKTIQEISEVKNILGLKEASGQLDFDKELLSVVKKDFVVLSGDDPTYLDFLNIGGAGVISVMTNLFPGKTIQWTELALTGRYSEAVKDFARYKKIIDLMYCEANPIPVKWMLFKQGLLRSAELRLPLMTLDSQFHQTIEQELSGLDLF